MIEGEATGLQTDLYQLTMAQGHWALGRADEQAVFHLGFRRAPFKAGFALACGLQQAVELVEGEPKQIEEGDLMQIEGLSKLLEVKLKVAATEPKPLEDELKQSEVEGGPKQIEGEKPLRIS